jgi:hypothetical protein
MGYTHFNQVVGQDGVFVGEYNQEVKVSQSFQNVHIHWASTANASWYAAAPTSGNVVAAYLTWPVAAATTGAYVISHGTAGGTFATFGAQVATVGSIATATLSGTVAVVAGELLKCTMTASATGINQVYQNLTIVYDRVGSSG